MLVILIRVPFKEGFGRQILATDLTVNLTVVMTFFHEYLAGHARICRCKNCYHLSMMFETLQKMVGVDGRLLVTERDERRLAVEQQVKL